MESEKITWLRDGRGPARRTSAHNTFFDRSELNQLLSLYSRRVATGEWRDYAIDHRAGMAIFSVFRHTLESPLYSIAKKVGPGGRKREFIVFSGRSRVKHGATLADAISVFEEKLRVVS